MPRWLIILLAVLVGLGGTWSTRGTHAKDRAQLLVVAWFPTLAGLLSLLFTQD